MPENSVPFYVSYLLNNQKEVYPEAWIKAVSFRLLTHDPSWYWEQFAHMQNMLEITCQEELSVAEAIIERKIEDAVWIFGQEDVFDAEEEVNV